MIDTIVVCGTAVAFGLFWLTDKLTKRFPTPDQIRARRHYLKEKLRLAREQKAELLGEGKKTWGKISFSHVQQMDDAIAKVLDELAKVPLSEDDIDQEDRERAVESMQR